MSLQKMAKLDKNWGISKSAIELNKKIKGSMNSSFFSMAEDMKKHNVNLFAVSKKNSSSKPVKFNFKWVSKKK